MNITTFNRPFDQRDLETIPPGVLAHGRAFPRPKTVMNSPLFLLEHDPTGAITKENFFSFLPDLFEDGDAMPFKALRLFVRAYDSETKLHLKLLAWWESGSILVQYGIRPSGPHPITYSCRMSSDGLAIAAYQRGMWGGEHDIPPEVLPWIEDSCQRVVNMLVCFLHMLHSPTTFTASVEPPHRGGKSVEWVKSRTHYVVLQRNHPANRKEVSSGSNVTVSDQDIKRMAHTRRAHTRILRSDRWGKNKGKTIRVKACWVGPKEWEQAGSIYRIVN